MAVLIPSRRSALGSTTPAASTCAAARASLSLPQAAAPIRPARRARDVFQLCRTAGRSFPLTLASGAGGRADVLRIDPRRCRHLAHDVLWLLVLPHALEARVANVAVVRPSGEGDRACVPRKPWAGTIGTPATAQMRFIECKTQCRLTTPKIRSLGFPSASAFNSGWSTGGAFIVRTWRPSWRTWNTFPSRPSVVSGPTAVPSPSDIGQ
jgi:hypothetical protein